MTQRKTTEIGDLSDGEELAKTRRLDSDGDDIGIFDELAQVTKTIRDAEIRRRQLMRTAYVLGAKIVEIYTAANTAASVVYYALREFPKKATKG